MPRVEILRLTAAAVFVLLFGLIVWRRARRR